MVDIHKDIKQDYLQKPIYEFAEEELITDEEVERLKNLYKMVKLEREELKKIYFK